MIVTGLCILQEHVRHFIKGCAAGRCCLIRGCTVGARRKYQRVMYAMAAVVYAIFVWGQLPLLCGAAFLGATAGAGERGSHHICGSEHDAEGYPFGGILFA